MRFEGNEAVDCLTPVTISGAKAKRSGALGWVNRIALCLVLLLTGGVAHGLERGDFYSETYKDFLSDHTINFQRLRGYLPVSEIAPWRAYGSLIHERYVDESFLSLEAGVVRSLGDSFTVMGGVRWMNVNSSPYRDIEPRIGLIGSRDWKTGIEKLSTGVYGEIFLIAPLRDRVQLAGDGWAHARYTVYERNHWILDAAMLEARTYRASNPAYSGVGFTALGIGPRASYWWESSGSASLYLARRVVHATGGGERWDDWFLFTVGARF